MSYKTAHLTVLMITVFGCGAMVVKFGGAANQTTVNIPQSRLVQVAEISNMETRGNIPPSPDGTASASVYVDPRYAAPHNGKSYTEVAKYETGDVLEDAEVYAEEIYQAKGLPPGLATATLRLESATGRHMVSKTGCLGWHQFCSKTAKHYGVTDPNDLVISTGGASDLAVDNRKSLSIYEMPGDGYHIYLSHMIGPKNTQTVHTVATGGTATKKWVKKAYKEMRSNWRRKSLGKMTGNYTIDFPKFYKYYSNKYNHVLSNSYTYPI